MQHFRIASNDRRGPELKIDRPRASRRIAPLATALLVSLSTLLPAPSARAADPPAAAAARHLAETRGGSTNDYELLSEAQAAVEHTDGTVWAGKFLDRRTGEIVAVNHDPGNGATAGPGLREERGAAAAKGLPALDRKADAALRAAVAKESGDEQLRVAAWLDVDTEPAEAAVRAAHPELTWLAGRPMVDSIEQARSLRAEMWEARQAAFEAATEALRPAVEANGGSIGYASTAAPLVFLDMPRGAVAALAERADVLTLGLEQQWEVSMSSAGPAIGADWTGDGGDQGSGIRVGVVEYHNVSNSGDLAGKVVASFSTSGRTVTGGHPTWVAGAVASQNATHRGVAPGSVIISAGTGGYTPSLSYDRAIIAAADWAVSPSGGNVDVLNASIGQDTAQGAEEARRYFDSIGWELNRLVVASSGNFTTFGNWNVVSPGTGYNVLTVGGIDDRNTGGTGDDVLWYVPGVNGANYVDPGGTPWNAHGDYIKPNLSAPAVSVRTANGITGDGTSVASPIVAGMAAQLIGRAPSLVVWPEATRALLMAGALRGTPLPGGGGISFDHEGVGTASAVWSNRILVNGNGPWGGYRIGAVHAGEAVAQDVPVVAGQQVRVALAWSSHTSGTMLGKADVLTADLDLRVTDPSGQRHLSISYDNSYEAVTFTAPATGTMKIEILQPRFTAAEEPYGLAWAMTSPFSDIAGSPFYADILWIAQQGITLGCGSGRYCPADAVTRGQMASFLVRALGLRASSTDYFDDDATSIHQADINALAAAGITLGCGSRVFCPLRPVTREEMASFLVRGLPLPPTSTDFFTDDGASPHQADINALAASGVTRGCTPTTYCPGSPVSREQMAAFLHRALTR
ncbi:MAG: S8 family serine peptidase [Chloroflexota bacterium]|nr:S8 family serine peptidase [Chloroflexota bacterium]